MGNDQGRPTGRQINTESLTDLRKYLETRSQELCVKEHEVLSLKKQLDQANATNDELALEKQKFKIYKQNRVLFAKREQDIFTKKITELQIKIDEMKRQIEYLNVANNARLNLNEFNLKKENILKEIDALNKQKESVTIDYTNLTTEIADFMKIKNILSREIDELQKMKAVSSGQLEEFNVKNSAASKEIDKLNDKKFDMLRRINELNKNLSSDDVMMNIWSPKNLTYSITCLTPSHLIIDCDSLEFNIVKEQFMKSAQKHFQVHKVQKINNPHLRAMKMLREKEHELLHGKAGVRQMLLYRTFRINPQKLAESSFLDNIHMFGFVKFSKISNHECHKSQIIGEWKCMIVSSVIVCDRCQSEPPASAGISVDYGKIEPMSVNVYREDTFYPEYLLYFTGETIA